MTYKQILESYYHMVRQLYRKKHEEKKTIKKGRYKNGSISNP